MADTTNTTVQETTVQETAAQESTAQVAQTVQSAPMGGITVKELLNYINMVQADNVAVVNALGMIGEETIDDVKANAIVEVVRCRETTNQKILAMYEKMYDDLVETPDNRKFQTACNLDLARLETKERLVKAMIESEIDSDTVARIFTEAEDLFT